MKETAGLFGLFLLSIVDGVVVWAALAVWRFGMKQPVDPAMIWVAAGITLYSCFRAWRRQVQRVATAAVAHDAKQNRVFVENPRLVLDLYRHENIRNPYLDQWIKISGSVEGTVESLLRDSVHVSVILDDGLRVILRFGMDSQDKLAALLSGQRVTAICQIKSTPIKSISGFPGFALSNCELIRIEPLAARSPKLARAS